MRRRQVAAEIRAAARAWEKRADEGDVNDDDDPRLAKEFRSDAKDLRKVARLVDEGHIQRARDAAGLDTIVRDQLPKAFFDLLEKHGVAW
jgi:hypothetical protein